MLSKREKDIFWFAVIGPQFPIPQLPQITELYNLAGTYETMKNNTLLVIETFVFPIFKRINNNDFYLDRQVSNEISFINLGIRVIVFVLRSRAHKLEFRLINKLELDFNLDITDIVNDSISPYFDDD